MYEFPPLHRRRFLSGGTALLAVGTGLALAETPIRVLVGYAAGGPADTTARIVAEKLGPLLGRTVIVENRPGAGGQIAAQALKAAAADGSTLMLTNTHTVALVPLTVKTAGYTGADFRTLGTLVDFDYAIAVHPGVRVNTVVELATWLANGRNGSGIGIPTQGSVPELIAQRIYAANSAEPVLVPYKGSAPMIQDLLAGQIAAGVGSVTDFLPYLDSARVRVLAATREHPRLPHVPSFSKAGITGIDLPDFLGLYAPIGLPDAIAKQYATALAQVSAMPEVAERFLQYGFSLAAADASAHALRLARMTKDLTALVQGAPKR